MNKTKDEMFKEMSDGMKKIKCYEDERNDEQNV